MQDDLITHIHSDTIPDFEELQTQKHVNMAVLFSYKMHTAIFRTSIFYMFSGHSGGAPGEAETHPSEGACGDFDARIIRIHGRCFSDSGLVHSTAWRRQVRL